MELPGRGRREAPVVALIAAGICASLALVLTAALSNTAATPGDLVRFLGRFHTLLVHTPIGVLLLVAAAEGLTLFPKLRPRVDPALGLALPFLAITALGAFMLGLLLARGGGYPAKLVTLHRNFTLAGVVGASVMWALWSFVARGDAWARAAYRAALGVTLGLISYGAHHGGSMTRGEDYLARYAPQPFRKWMGGEPEKKPTEEEAPAPSSEPLVFADVVKPILKAKCVECHGPDESKGSLRLDDLEAILKGGKEGPALVPGNVEKSPLVTRMLLPHEHDDHMPPAEKPDVTPAEVEVIRFWVERGASDTMKVKDALPPDAARELLLNAIKDGPAKSTPTPPPSEPKPETSSEPSAPPAPPVEGGDGLVYRDRVAPVLEARCGGCHGAAKHKGKLRVDSIEAMLGGGKSGPALVAGHPESSRLLTATKLPLEHDDHMPPRKDPQPTAAELELIEWWIKSGASADLKVTELPETLRGAAPVAAQPPPQPQPEPSTPPVEPPPDPEIDLATLPREVHLVRDVVTPALHKKCGICHEGVGVSGGFRLDDRKALLAGGDSGPGVVPKHPEKGTLLKRVRLPLDHDDHMPPKDMAQLTRGEVAAIEHWIAMGAEEDFVVETASLPKQALPAIAIAFPPSVIGTGGAPATGGAPPTGGGAPSSGGAGGDAAGGAPPLASASASASAHLPHGTGPEPGRGGCASCTVGAAGDDALFGLLTLSAFALVLLRRRPRA